MITTRFGWGVRKWVKKKVTKQDWTVATAFDNGQINTDFRNRTPEPVQAPQIGQGTEAENIAAAPWLNNVVNTQVPTLQAPTTPTPAELWQPQGIQKPLQPIGGTIPKGVQTPDSINPTTWEKFNADGTPFTPISPIAQTDEQKRLQKIADVETNELAEQQRIKEERDKTLNDTKRGYALWKAKFEENKANYTNYNEINSKYNAVIDEITSNMSDTGVVDESVYQSIANKYWIPIEQVKNPNRILDWAELSDEGKEKLGVNTFEQGIADSTKDFERTQEDLQNRITQTKESYNNQMNDLQQNVSDTIQWITWTAAASGNYRSTSVLDSMRRTKEQWEKIFERLQSSKGRAVWDISTSLSRITEDFNQSITQARKDFNNNLLEVNVANNLALNEAQLSFTGEKLKQIIADIEEEYSTKSSASVTASANAIAAINNAVNGNLDLADRLIEQEEARELKSYNEYLENDWLLLQATSLDELVQWVQNGTITPESAQNLRKIMQSGIQETLSALAPLDTNDIDNINYLLEQGYTPEQAIAQIQETFDKFTPTVEKKYREFGGDLYEETAEGLKSVIEGKEDITYKEFEGNLYRETEDGLVLEKERTTATSTWAWKKLDDNTLYNEDTGASKSIKPWTSYSGSLWNGNITGYGGAYESPNDPSRQFVWLDIDGAIGDPIFFPEELTVVSAWEAWDYGNSIVVQRENWDKLRFSHNDEMFFKEWDVIGANETFATIWNTGNVLDINGNKPSAEQLSSWIGSHIDLVIERADWTVMKSKQVEQYINGIDNVATKTDGQFTAGQKAFLDNIAKVEDLSETKNMKALEELWITLEEASEYKSQNITTQKAKEYTTALDLLDKMMWAWDWDWFSDAIGLFSLARKTADDGTITYRPWTDAADFKAQYDALVDGLTLPNLDKMTWVLTDKDIELLKNASKWGLSLTMSEGDFKKSVVDLREVLQKAAWFEETETQNDALDDEFFNTPQTEEDFFNNL